MANPASGYAICGVAAAVTISADGKVEDVAIGLAGAGPTAVSLAATAGGLTGEQATDEAVAAAAASAADGLQLPSDLAAPGTIAHICPSTDGRLRRAIRRATEGAKRRISRIPSWARCTGPTSSTFSTRTSSRCSISTPETHCSSAASSGTPQYYKGRDGLREHAGSSA
jgi:hypothetical protein